MLGCANCLGAHPSLQLWTSEYFGHLFSHKLKTKGTLCSTCTSSNIGWTILSAFLDFVKLNYEFLLLLVSELMVVTSFLDKLADVRLLVSTFV